MKNVKVVKLFTKVKEVMETDNYEEVNKRIHGDWILMNIVPNSDKLTYILGRVDLN